MLLVVKKRDENRDTRTMHQRNSSDCFTKSLFGLIAEAIASYCKLAPGSNNAVRYRHRTGQRLNVRARPGSVGAIARRCRLVRTSRTSAQTSALRWLMIRWVVEQDVTVSSCHRGLQYRTFRSTRRQLTSFTGDITFGWPWHMLHHTANVNDILLFLCLGANCASLSTSTNLNRLF